MSDADAGQTWTDDEAEFLSRHVTNLHLPVFALTNLPEAVKGALFARYSRSPKSLRELLVDEFRQDLDTAGFAGSSHQPGSGRASDLYERIHDGYGDDSVAQLGSAHVACEEVSNILTKILERGRLMSYLEQSTRYINYSAPLRGRWRYQTPSSLPETAATAYTEALDVMFESYKAATETVMDHLGAGEAADVATARALRAQALDATRGMLPAAALSNVGIHGSGQAFEQMLIRMSASPVAEANDYARMMLAELRKVIPEFLRRVDTSKHGMPAIDYRTDRLKALRDIADSVMENVVLPPPDSNSVMLLDFDPYAERKVAAAAMWPHLSISEARVRDTLSRVPASVIDEVFEAIKGDRGDRRHKPGRELEAAVYRFEVVSDYGAYRDLQRHRMLTIEAQPLSADLGFEMSPLIDEAGARSDWDRCLEASESAHRMLLEESPENASYPVAMAFRMRYLMQFNAREAMHMIELRSQPQGHPSYRRIVQEMLRQIEHEARHERIASLFSFADMSDGVQGRLASEQRATRRKQA